MGAGREEGEGQRRARKYLAPKIRHRYRHARDRRARGGRRGGHAPGRRAGAVWEREGWTRRRTSRSRRRVSGARTTLARSAALGRARHHLVASTHRRCRRRRRSRRGATSPTSGRGARAREERVVRGVARPRARGRAFGSTGALPRAPRACASARGVTTGASETQSCRLRGFIGRGNIRGTKPAIRGFRARFPFSPIAESRLRDVGAARASASRPADRRVAGARLDR